MWVDHGKLWKTTFNSARNHDTAPLLRVAKDVFPAAFLAELLPRALRLHQDASLTLWQTCEFSKRLGTLYMPLAALLSRTKQHQDAHRRVSRRRGCRFSVRFFSFCTEHRAAILQNNDQAQHQCINLVWVS